MTVYNGTRMATGYVPKLLPVGLTEEYSSFTITAAFVINDTINFLKIPSNPGMSPGNNGPIISSVVADLPSLDSSTGIVTAVGDATTAGRFIAGSVIGRSGAGGVQYNNVAGSVGYAPFAALYNTYTTVSYQEYTVIFKVTTAATGTAATTGTITLKVAYNLDA